MERVNMNKMLTVLIAGMLVFASVIDVQARRRKGPPPAIQSIKGSKSGSAPFSLDEEITVVPHIRKGVNRILVTDNCNRILKSFVFKTAPQEKPADPKKKTPPAAAKPVTFTLGETSGSVNRILLVDKSGKLLARSSFGVKTEDDPWSDFQVWLYRGHRAGGAEGLHYRSCFFKNESYLHGSAGLAFGPNFADNQWGGFMSAHRKGNYTGSRVKLKRKPSFNDPAFIKKCVGYAKSRAAACAKGGQAAFSLHEMPSTTLYADPFDFDISGTALTAFREWCKKKYKKLSALNKQWDTEFKKWEDVVPETTNQTRARNNPKYKECISRIVAGIMIPERRLMHDEFPEWETQNYSAWSDHREFMDDSFAALLKQCAQAADVSAPTVRTGILGTMYPSAFGGYDYAKLVSALDWFEPCGLGMSWDLFASLGGPEQRLTKTVSVGGPSIQRYVINTIFLKGGHGVILREARNMWDRRKIRGTGMTYLRNTLKDLTRGLGKLRMIAEDAPHPIAIYHNQASQRMAWLTDSLMDGTAWPRRLTFHHQPRDSMVRAYTGISLALEDSGYQTRAVSGDQVRKQGLKDSDLKVIFTSRIEALSDEEADALTHWVKAGGTLITDGALGSMDPQCKRRQYGLLERIAGIDRKNFRLCDMDGGYFPFYQGLTRKKDGAKTKLLDGVKVEALLVHCPDLRAGKAEVFAQAGEAPVLSVRKFGKGQVICANVYWADYIRGRELGGARAALSVLARNLVKSAGLEPYYQVTVDAKDASAPQIEQYLFKDGKTAYAAFNVQARPLEYPHQSSRYHNNYKDVTGISPPKWTGPITANGRLNIYNIKQGDLIPVTVTFPEKAHVYDSRTGSYLGEKKTVSVKLDPMGFAWLAQLPYKVNNLQVSVKSADGDPGLLEYDASIAAAGGAPGRHVLHMSVTDPDGRICDFLSRNIVANAGKTQGKLRIPENGKKGTWTIQLRDTATGVIGKTEFTKTTDPLLAGKLPISFPVKKGRLFAQLQGASDVNRANGQCRVSVPAAVWREGVKDSAGKIRVQVNSPWKLQQNTFDLAAITAEQAGEFMITVSCKASDLEKTNLEVTMNVKTDDGKSLKKASKIEGKKLASRLKESAPVTIEFNYYHPDIQRVLIEDDKCVCTMPLRVQTSAARIPSGKIRLSANKEWTLEPAEIDLEQALLSANGQNTIRLVGPLKFKESPVVTVEVKTDNGFTLNHKRYLPVCRSEYTAKAPVLDGVFDEPCWKNAQKETHSFRSVGKVAPEKFPIHFRVCHDDKNVYIAAEIKGLDPRILRVNAPVQDGFEDAIWCDDNLQVFFDPTQGAGEVTYRMVMNYLGRKYSTAGEDLTKYGWPGWKVDWEMKGRKISDGYAVELVVPYSLLNTTVPKSGDVWAMNVVRMTTEPYHGWPDYYGSWADVGSSVNASHWEGVPGCRISSHLFGRLLFVGGKKK